MTQISTSLNPSCHILVMDGTIGQMAHAQASAFKSSIPIGSIIITKLDGHAKGGGALSAVAATCSPIMFLGTGEGIHDLDTFNAKQFVGKLLGLGDVQGVLYINAVS